jgi:ABC-type nitrate/sulfonate/bicarbonate transport system permease component
MIIRATSRLQTDLLFVAIGVLGILGISLFLIIVLIETTLLNWYEGTTTL